MTESAPRKFDFDTWFDEDGQILSQAPVARMRRAYSPAEVEAIRADAFAEGQADQRGRDESETARALGQIADACVQALGGLDQVVARYRRHAADLAMEIGGVLSSEALERFPQAPLAAALEALSEELSGTTRLVVRLNGGGGDAQATVERAVGEAGFAGRVLVRDEPALQAAAFTIEWPDGRAEYNPTEAADRVRAALSAALSAEADGGIDLMDGDQ